MKLVDPDADADNYRHRHQPLSTPLNLPGLSRDQPLSTNEGTKESALILKPVYCPSCFAKTFFKSAVVLAEMLVLMFSSSS